MSEPTSFAEQVLAERDEVFRPQLEFIGRAIGYGRSCQILGELWDDMLERDFGLPRDRGRMERRHDIEIIEVKIRALRADLEEIESGYQQQGSKA